MTRPFTNFGLLAGLAVAFGIMAPQMQSVQQSAATFVNGKEEISVGDIFLRVDPRVQQRSYMFKETNERLPYALFVSSKVTKAKKAPLIVALHGRGANQSALELETYRTVEMAEQGGYILVAPMGYNSNGWYGAPVGRWPGAEPARNSIFADNGGKVITDRAKAAELSEKDVINVLTMIREEFNVDEHRTYLLGHSMGGAGTLYLGVKYSENWAAIAAVAPAVPPQLDPSTLAAIKDMPVILVHGDADPSVPVASTRRWVDKLRELNMTYEYHEIPGGDHGSVVATTMPDIFSFFSKHAK